jgi:hypothetical protein
MNAAKIKTRIEDINLAILSLRDRVFDGLAYEEEVEDYKAMIATKRELERALKKLDS